MDKMTTQKKAVPETAAFPIKRPMLAMMGMLIGGFVGMLSETSLNIALPSLMTQLNIGVGTAQWLVTGYMLVIGIVLPLSSLLSRWLSTRTLIIFALIDFMVGAAISALASTFSILLIGRMIQGIATGLILPLMFTVATLIFPPHKLGSAMGMISLVIMFAPAIGPTLAGIIIGALSWQWLFWAFIPFLLLGLIFAVKYLPNVGKLSKPKVDLFSILLSTLGFGGLVTGVSLASDHGWTSPLVLSILVVALIILAVYIRRQLNYQTPILNFKVFQRRNFAMGSVLVMLDFGIILSSMYLLPMFWQKGLAIPVALTGIVMLPGGVVNAVFSAIAGRFYDRIGAKKLAVSGFTIALIGIIMLLFTTKNTAMGYVITAHIVMMIGVPLAMSPVQTFGLNALDPMTASDGSTIMNTFQQIIGAVSTAVATSLLAIGQSTSTAAANSQTAFTNGVHLGLIFPLILTIAALIITLFIKEERHNA
nr:DHA2 family efflux MFS transporter permease subunit [Agrilactobacillus yilanensis]